MRAAAATALAAPALLVLAAVLLLPGGEPPSRGKLRTSSAAGAEESGPAVPVIRATTPAEVRQVLRYCRRAGTEEQGTLRRLALDARDPLITGNAIRALGRLRAFLGDPGLTALLHDARLRVRQEAVVALGESGDPSAVGLLAPLINKEDRALRPLVIQALGRLGGNRARQLLEGVLSDPEATPTEHAFARAALAEKR